jgi:hypothetical protein
VIENVKPGNYRVFVQKKDAGSWGNRVAKLMVIHEDHLKDNLQWEHSMATIGVDSGQCGIFSMESYRSDIIAEKIGLGDGDISFFSGFGRPQEDGEQWYMSMCSRTLGVLQWGSYYCGVVSSSGYGDGSYDLFESKDGDGKIISLCVDYGVYEGDFDDDDEDGEQMVEVDLDFYQEEL